MRYRDSSWSTLRAGLWPADRAGLQSRPLKPDLKGWTASGWAYVGGTVARVKPDATAYWNRAAQWDLLLAGAWFEHAQDQHNAAALRDLRRQLLAACAA